MAEPEPEASPGCCGCCKKVAPPTGPHSNRPANVRWKQQQLPAWQPIMSPMSIMIWLFSIALVFIPLGGGFVWLDMQTTEQVFRYDDVCGTASGASCVINVSIPTAMSPTVYVYYQLENFYQNHRRYVKSVSWVQLMGGFSWTNGSVWNDPNGYCDPVSNRYPCGLVAWSVFNDTFTMTGNNFTNWTTTGIAWPEDLSAKFAFPPGQNASTTGFNIVDEHFVVWMRVAALPTFRKLYAIISNNLAAGNYTVNITNNYPVSNFTGKKLLVFSTVSVLGGKNPFLGYCFVVVGALSFAFGLFFAIKNCVSPRMRGDLRYLDWNLKPSG